MGITVATWKASKCPLKLLTGLLKGKTKKTKTEQEKKQLAHIQNFDPTRLNNRSWQKSIGKKKKKKAKN